MLLSRRRTDKLPAVAVTSPVCQMALRQQQPVPGVLYEAAAGL